MKAVRMMGRRGAIAALSAAISVASIQTAAAEPKAGEVEKDSLKGETMTFTSWGANYQDMQMKALEDFAAQSGATIVGDGPTELAKIKAQVESGNVQWDVVVSGFVSAEKNCGTLFMPLDRAYIDDTHIPPGTGFKCNLPTDIYGTVLVYNPEKYGSNPPKSWADFFDLEKFPGKRGFPRLSSSIEPGMLEQALLADGVPRDKLYPLDVDRAFKKLRGMRDSLVMWTSGAESQQLIESKEVDMIAIWNGSALDAVRNGSKYVPVWKDWLPNTDGLVVPMGVKNPKASFAMVNYLLGEKAQKFISENTGYSPVNTNAKPEVDALTASWMLGSPERQSDMFRTDLANYIEQYDSIVAEWTKFISGN